MGWIIFFNRKNVKQITNKKHISGLNPNLTYTEAKGNNSTQIKETKNEGDAISETPKARKSSWETMRERERVEDD